MGNESGAVAVEISRLRSLTPSLSARHARPFVFARPATFRFRAPAPRPDPARAESPPLHDITRHARSALFTNQ